MRILKVSLKLLSFLLLLNIWVSCENEDEPVGLSEDDIVENLSDGVIIRDGVKVDGALPASTNSLDLFVENTLIAEAAFEDLGFDLYIGSNAPAIAGAYLQFSDDAGNVASNYFDVPLTNFDRWGTIDIDLKTGFPLDVLCVTIIIYDDNLNTSDPIEYCLPVARLAGNSDLIGEWEMDSMAIAPLDIFVEHADADAGSFTCDNGNEILVLYDKYSLLSGSITLSENGDYKRIQHSSIEDLRRDATAEQCTAVYADTTREANIQLTGYWSYDSSTEQGVFLDTEYTNLETNYSSEDTGYLRFRYEKINDNQLIIKILSLRPNSDLVILEYFLSRKG